MMGSLDGPGGRFSKLLVLGNFRRQNQGRKKKKKKRRVMTVRSHNNEIELRDSEKISMSVIGRISNA